MKGTTFDKPQLFNMICTNLIHGVDILWKYFSSWVSINYKCVDS